MPQSRWHHSERPGPGFVYHEDAQTTRSRAAQSIMSGIDRSCRRRFSSERLTPTSGKRGGRSRPGPSGQHAPESGEAPEIRVPSRTRRSGQTDLRCATVLGEELHGSQSSNDSLRLLVTSGKMLAQFAGAEGLVAIPTPSQAARTAAATTRDTAVCRLDPRVGESVVTMGAPLAVA
jgi:hypothetical protein